jgi:hypothetical protein
MSYIVYSTYYGSDDDDDDDTLPALTPYQPPPQARRLQQPATTATTGIRETRAGQRKRRRRCYVTVTPHWHSTASSFKIDFFIVWCVFFLFFSFSFTNQLLHLIYTYSNHRFDTRQ